VTGLAWSTLHVTGRDAAVFLDGQLSQDLSTAATGAWTLLLDPDSTVITAAWIRGGETDWELLVPTELAERTETRLRRFMIRVQCELVMEPTATSPPLESIEDLFEQRWPWVAEFAAELSPHSFGSSFVASTVSFTKGCFTGQELVGRMDARGATMPWRFVLAQGPSLEAIDTTLRSKGPDGPQGVTTSRVSGSTWWALGFAHRSLFTSAERPGDVVVEEIS
jgi:folate-binding protein YgfZ